MMKHDNLMAGLIVASAIFLSVPATADEQVIKLLPTGEEYQPDFKIAICTELRGIGRFHYDHATGISAISDFCINEENGVVMSAETRSGFQIVSKTKTARAYEVLSSGSDEHSRVRLVMTANSDWFSDCNADGAHRIEYYVPDNNLQHFSEKGYAYSLGHTVPYATKVPLNSATQSVYLSLRSFSQAALPEQTKEIIDLPHGADFSGEIAFNDTEATFSVSSGLGRWVGDSSGAITLQVHDDTSWQGTGTITAQSARLAGHKPKEWVSMSIDVRHMRGFIVGEDGRQMVAYGLVSGSYVDASEGEHKFHASASLEACFDPDRQ